MHQTIGLTGYTGRPVAALAIDKAGPRPYHFRSGPTPGPTNWLHKGKKFHVMTQNFLQFTLYFYYYNQLYSSNKFDRSIKNKKQNTETVSKQRQ